MDQGQSQGWFIFGSQVPAVGSQVQVFSTRFGCGIFLHLHPNLNTRTRYLTVETRDLKMHPSANLPVSGFPLSDSSSRHQPPEAATRHLKTNASSGQLSP